MTDKSILAAPQLHCFWYLLLKVTNGWRPSSGARLPIELFCGQGTSVCPVQVVPVRPTDGARPHGLVFR